MEKIISSTLEIEVVHESVQELKEVSYFEEWKADINSRATGLTSVGYDDEIGLLWDMMMKLGCGRSVYIETTKEGLIRRQH